jgi:thiosulfate/3-mercaptopyruvate sulfurtransferase
MRAKEPMLKDATNKAALALIGAAVLGPAFQHLCAQERNRPAVRSEMLVSTSVLEQHLNDRDLVILYVGHDRGEFDSRHIPGSRFVRFDDLVEQHKDSLNELPPVEDLQAMFESLGVGDESRVVLTGDTGGVLAARAYFTLDYLGHGDHAALLDGGLETWIAESRRTSKEETAIASAHFNPHLQPDILVSTAQMRKLSLAVNKSVSDYVLLDARPLAEFTGVVNSEAVPKAGHIVGSQSLYWKKLIRSDANPQLLDPEQLQQQFMRVGAVPGKSVITYCRTGMQSSFTYFVAKYLGYRAAMYDGSVYEWVRSAGNELVKSPAPERASTVHQ